jgi:hypothetical protein
MHLFFKIDGIIYLFLYAKGTHARPPYLFVPLFANTSSLLTSFIPRISPFHSPAKRGNGTNPFYFIA